MPTFPTMRYAILTSLWLTFVVGCDRTTEAPSAVSPKLSIAFLGDDIRVHVAERFASDSALKLVVPPKHSDAAVFAEAAFNADFVFLVTDATQGPLPIHREHAMILRQLGITSIGLMFANTDQLAGMADAAELLELEELEVRELLNTYDLPGDDLTCFHDTKLPAIESAEPLILGVQATQEWLKRQEPRSRVTPPSTTTKTLESDIYMMSQQESAHAKELGNGDSVHIFINGRLRTCTVESKSQLPLASSSSAELHFDDSIGCAVGDRFLVITSGHAIGAGVVTGIGS